MSRAHSGFIPSEKVEAAKGYEFSAVDQAALRFAAKLKAQAEEEERARNQVERQAGHAAGYAEGYAQGHSQATLDGQKQMQAYIANEGDAAARRFFQQFELAQTQLQASEQAIAKGTLELACEIARQVLRRELNTNPNALQPVMREALGMLTSDTKVAVVRLNPLDVDVFSDVFKAEFAHLSLTLLPDASITRGGCLVESAGTVIDGTIERRWQKTVASLGLESTWEEEGDVR